MPRGEEGGKRGKTGAARRGIAEFIIEGRRATLKELRKHLGEGEDGIKNRDGIRKNHLKPLMERGILSADGKPGYKKEYYITPSAKALRDLMEDYYSDNNSHILSLFLKYELPDIEHDLINEFGKFLRDCYSKHNVALTEEGMKFEFDEGIFSEIVRKYILYSIQTSADCLSTFLKCCDDWEFWLEVIENKELSLLLCWEHAFPTNYDRHRDLRISVSPIRLSIANLFYIIHASEYWSTREGELPKPPMLFWIEKDFAVTEEEREKREARKTARFFSIFPGTPIAPKRRRFSKAKEFISKVFAKQRKT